MLFRKRFDKSAGLGSCSATGGVGVSDRRVRVEMHLLDIYFTDQSNQVDIDIKQTISKTCISSPIP